MPTILVVEDDFEVLELTCLLLVADGHKVVRARSADDALALLHARADVDVLFTDIYLRHGSNGLTLLECLRDEGRTIPAILASGDCEATADVPRHLPAAASFLPKPYGRSQLLAAVSACCAVLAAQQADD